MDIIKTIIPAAGFGTRCLPYTKAVPKEMLPLPYKSLMRPAIEIAVEEAMLSEIRQFLIVTAHHKQAIANHFDNAPELEHFLKEKQKQDVMAGLEKIIKHAEFVYVHQAEQRGLGHAVWMARNLIGKEHFGIMLPDDLIISKTPALLQLLRIARQEKASVIAVQEMPSEMLSAYGVVGIKKQFTPSLFQIHDVIEKPQPKDAPSSLAIVGRYILSHKIFASLEAIEPSKNGEIQLTDAISNMLKNNEKVFAYKIQGTRYDIGTPNGWLRATIDLALQDPAFANTARSTLATPELKFASEVE